MVGFRPIIVKPAGSSGRGPQEAAMRLDIYSDTICPWCYVGKRRLERALALRQRPDLTIQWRAFQLNPGMPAEGMDRREYLEVKFGGSDRAGRIYEAVRAAGQSEGIDFAFERMQRTPNTFDSHRLLRFAVGAGRQAETLEALFQAYFLSGADIGDRRVLLECAERAGLDAAGAELFLESGAEAEATLAEDRMARRQGINGVPCFIFNGRFALSGAQPPEALAQLLDLADMDDTMQLEAAAE
jgi:predicted DsbA family dithiol-disulfide isomerase